MRKRKYSVLAIALGAGIGAGLGVALNDIGTWLAIGIACGLIFGMGLDRYKQKK